jgi:hypothetical protein
MNTITSVLLITFIFTILSCDKVDVVEPGNNAESKVKRKLYYNYITDEIPFKTSEYLYDNEKRLERINHYSGSSSNTFGYEIFEYSSDNKIINRLTYQYTNDSIVWVLYDSTYYSYYNERLMNEETLYFSSSSDYISYKYEYENSYLVRKFKYYNYQLESYTKYDYSEGFCIKETMFSDSVGLNTIEYLIHHYENGVLLKSERFISNGNNIQIITYTYNEEGNLTIEEAKQTDFTVVKPMYYVIRYEY